MKIILAFLALGFVVAGFALPKASEMFPDESEFFRLKCVLKAELNDITVTKVSSPDAVDVTQIGDGY